MFVLYIALFIILIGVLYQYFSVKRDEKYFIPRGEFVDVDGTRLHYFGEGKKSPTVIFDSGHSVSLSLTDWSLVQPEIAKEVRTIVYDRAGMGMSQKSNNPRNSNQIVEELYTLLRNSREKGPYILVGHSFGALNMSLFASRYPEEVAGIIFVDGGSVDYYRQYFKPSTVKLMTVMISISMLLNKIGFFRLFGKLGFIPHVKERKNKFSNENSLLDEAFFYKHYSNQPMLQEASQLTKSVEQVSKVTTLGNIPIVVITAGKTEMTHKNWIHSQRTLLSLSTNSKHILVEESGHFIHIDYPDVVIDAIKDVINKMSLENQSQAHSTI